MMGYFMWNNIRSLHSQISIVEYFCMIDYNTVRVSLFFRDYTSFLLP